MKVLLFYFSYLASSPFGGNAGSTEAQAKVMTDGGIGLRSKHTLFEGQGEGAKGALACLPMGATFVGTQDGVH